MARASHQRHPLSLGSRGGIIGSEDIESADDGLALPFADAMRPDFDGVHLGQARVFDDLVARDLQAGRFAGGQQLLKDDDAGLQGQLVRCLHEQAVIGLFAEGTRRAGDDYAASIYAAGTS